MTQATSLLSVTDLSSSRSITFEYDTLGVIARVVEGGGIAVTHLTYSSGKLTDIAVKDALGVTMRELSFIYDVNGLLWQMYRDGDLATAVTFTYQATGGSGLPMANMSYPGGSSAYNFFGVPPSGVYHRVKRTNVQGGIESYDFNQTGDLLKVTLPAPNGTTTAPVYAYTYDSSRNLSTKVVAGVTTTYTYNSLGKVTDAIESPANQHLTYTYSGVDRVTAADTQGTFLTLAYTDSANPHSPTTITDGAGRTWTTTYNAYGQPLSVTPPSGSPSGATAYTYEETTSNADYGYLRSITNGASDVTTFDSYSPLGDALSVTTSPTTGVTHTTTYTFDADRRLTSIQHPDSTTFSRAYTGRHFELDRGRGGDGV